MQTEARAAGIEPPKLSAHLSLDENLAIQPQRVVNVLQQTADLCSDQWNSVHAALGSFADEHSTL